VAGRDWFAGIVHGSLFSRIIAPTQADIGG
jgi:hypothetical protein